VDVCCHDAPIAVRFCVSAFLFRPQICHIWDTSITTRVEQVKAQGRTGELKAAEQGSAAGSNAAAGLEESVWLCPVEDRRKIDSSREPKRLK
jgi:hypothetical protein